MEEEKKIAPAGDKTSNKPVAASRNAKQNRGGKGSSRPQQRRFARRDEPEYEEKVVKITKVTKVVKGGKRMKFTALTVIGDGKGKFGYALGKSGEVPEAIKKALSKAKRNMYKVEIVKGDTIAHSVMGKFGATSVFLKPAPEGTGLVAGGAVRAILELAGIKNVYSKIYGSRTQTNVVKATVDGLKQLKSYSAIQASRFGKTITPAPVVEEASEASEAK